jgi:hypothetical protein
MSLAVRADAVTTRQASPFQRVLDELSTDPSTDFGRPGARVDVLRTIDGRFSSVQHVRVTAPDRTTGAYIKVLKPRSGSREDLAGARRAIEREYRLTHECWAALRQDAALGAVRPIAVLPGLYAMVTEEVPGRPFGELLARSSRSPDDLRTIAANVGRWVRAYQAAEPVGGVVEMREQRLYVDRRLQQLEGRVFAPEARRLLLEQFDALARAVAPSVPAVRIHADLTPANVIAGESGRVTILDFTMAKAGTAHHDLAHVYFHLELMAARRPKRRRLFRALQTALLAGYDPALTPVDPQFRLMLLQHSVCHLVHLAERRVPIVDAAYRWFLRRRWKNCEQLLAVA